MNRILVLGGTGLLGRPAALRLQADGFEVRCLARNPEKARALLGEGCRVVPGDLSDQARLEEAMAGCDGVHISVGGTIDRQSAENVAALAPRLGVQRITYLSGSTVDEQNRWFPMVAQKLDAEEAIVGSGVPYTIFRPTWPMEQLPRFVQGDRALVIGDALPRLHWFAAADLARMLSAGYRSEAAANRRLYVHGPEAWSMVEAVEAYRAAARPEIEGVTVLPVEAARAQAAATGNRLLGMMAEMMGYFDRAGELGDPTEANRILGPPATTLASWVAALGAGGGH